MLLIVLKTNNLNEIKKQLDYDCVNVKKFKFNNYSYDDNLLGIDFFIFNRFFNFDDKLEVSRYLKEYYTPESVSYEFYKALKDFCEEEGFINPYEFQISDWEKFINIYGTFDYKFPSTYDVKQLDNKILIFDEYELCQNLINDFIDQIETIITDY